MISYFWLILVDSKSNRINLNQKIQSIGKCQVFNCGHGNCCDCIRILDIHGQNRPMHLNNGCVAVSPTSKTIVIVGTQLVSMVMGRHHYLPTIMWYTTRVNLQYNLTRISVLCRWLLQKWICKTDSLKYNLKLIVSLHKNRKGNPFLS